MQCCHECGLRQVITTSLAEQLSDSGCKLDSKHIKPIFWFVNCKVLTARVCACQCYITGLTTKGNTYNRPGQGLTQPESNSRPVSNETERHTQKMHTLPCDVRAAAAAEP